ncbi:hypothetical protein [Streptomyces sp. GbtcB6]|uniref:hypothetical protein n=1 Tax=Streptomyces sp. GbtcB6 TaxID=2824751 RepID=UPI001C2FEA82|nr:hypothetical protein [Streptomyces sp. GbtcB6]
MLNDRVTVLAQLPLPGPHARCRTTRYGFTPDGLTDAPSMVARIGEVVLTGGLTGLTAHTGLAIKNATPFPASCVVTTVDGTGT